MKEHLRCRETVGRNEEVTVIRRHNRKSRLNVFGLTAGGTGYGRR